MGVGFWNLGRPCSILGLAEWDESVDLESIHCPANAGHRRAGRRLTNLSVLLTSKQIKDFVWTWYSECLIQDHVLRLFRDEGITGFDVKPVRARMKIRAKHRDWCDDNPGLKESEAAAVQIPRLWELVVTGWAGMAPPESGIFLRNSCDACGHLRYTIWTDASRLIDEEQWDGSDIFMVWPMPKFIFITDRVAKLIRKHKLTGAKLVRSEQLEPYVWPGAGLSPGRLRYSMPEERARELGEPLGIY